MDNIVQLQGQLKGLSDDQLAQQMQQPSGVVPPYLLLTEIQRRNTMQDEAKTGAPMAGQPTIAQQAVGQLKQGIASAVPAQTQPQPQPQVQTAPVPGMAGGGTYDETPQLDQAQAPDWKSILPTAMRLNGSILGQGVQSLLPQSAIDALQAPYNVPLIPKWKQPSGASPLQHPVSQAQATTPDAPRDIAVNQNIPTDTAPGDGAPPPPDPYGALEATLMNGGGGGADTSGIAAAMNGSGGYSGGNNWGQFAGLLDKRQKDADQNLDQDKWLALAQAGFGMANAKGTSFLGALAQGGQQGIASYKAAKDDYNKTVNDLLEQRMKLTAYASDDKRADASLSNQIKQDNVGNSIQMARLNMEGGNQDIERLKTLADIQVAREGLQDKRLDRQDTSDYRKGMLDVARQRASAYAAKLSGKGGGAGAKWADDAALERNALDVTKEQFEQNPLLKSQALKDPALFNRMLGQNKARMINEGMGFVGGGLDDLDDPNMFQTQDN